MSLTLGVVADTHVPDRVQQLHPEILPIFDQAAVCAILHAGDICTPQILQELSQVAPVHAVRGNRDGWQMRDLPLTKTLEFGRVNIGMLHGHGGFWTYVWDSVESLLRGGLSYTRYITRLQSTFPSARVIVFGHIHRPLNLLEDGQLLFNPGAASIQISPNIPPSVGLLRLTAAGEVVGELKFLSRLNG